MPFVDVTELDDPRLDVYRHLKKTNLTRWSGQFIVEGKKLTIQLLQSDFQVASVLTSQKYVHLLEPYVCDAFEIYVLPHQVAQMLVGHSFHMGMLGCGIRKPSPSLAELIPTRRRHLFAVCCGTENPENVGSIIRIAAGFDATAILLGAACCDPFSRRALRVSMGNALRLPIIECSQELPSLLGQLREEHDTALFATVLDDGAEILRNTTCSGSVALLFGNEEAGLDSQWIEMCDRRVTIPMASGTDSLNVSVAAGIFLHHFAGQIHPS